MHSLMMFVVLHHLLAGCCGHHAHHEPSNRGDVDSLVSVCRCHGHEGHDDGHGSRSHPQSSQDTHCDHGKCCFVVPKTDGGIGSVDGTNVVSIVRWGVAPRIDPLAGHCSDRAPPLGISPHRLHLMNQVLLI